MIKWLWFWKSLKLFYSSLLISCFILLGSSVNSYKIQQVWLDSSPSTSDSNYNITFLKWWWLLTNYIWYWKNVLALDWWTFFWWASNWLPYIYWGPYANFQWFFNTFMICSPITWLDSVPWNCSYSSLTSDSIVLLKNFYSSIVPWDYVYYNYSYWTDNSARWWQNIEICFSSQAIWNSMCFVDSCNYNWADLCGTYLSDSQGYSDLSFASIPSNSIGPAPWQAGYNWEFNWSSGWSIQWSVDSSITWDFVYSTCTVGYAKAKYEKYWLTSDLCYAWLSLDSSWVAVSTPWTWVNVFDLYNVTNDWRNFCNWYQYWVSNYVNRYVISPSIFWSQPSALYSYFDIINRLNPEMLDWCGDIQNYCKIIVNNMDLNSTWNWSSSACPIVSWPWISDDWWDSVNNTWVVWDWKTPIWVNWNWVGGSSSVVEQKDAMNFIQDFFNKAKSVIPTDYSDSFWNWFIPSYIVVFLLAIILFRFLRH